MARGLIDLDGTFRLCRPEETWARLAPLLAPAGITRVANVTGLDMVGTPTCMVVRPLSRSLSVSQGKGLTWDLARVSGVMESMEAFHAENFVAPGFTVDTGEYLMDTAFMSVADLPLRPEVRAGDLGLMHWIEAEPLAGERRYIPRELVDMDFTLSNAWRQQIFAPSSNGLAGGNTREEALIHALCEVIERDEIAFWLVAHQFAGQADATRMKIDGIDDPLCADLIGRCREAGLQLAIWDASQSIGVPCFMAAIHDAEGRTLYHSRASGSGCHPLRRVALLRALTEAFQSRLTNIAGTRDDKFWSHYREDLDVGSEVNTDWVGRIAQEPEVRRWSDVEEAPPDIDPLRVVEWLLTRLKAAGLDEVCLVDLTTPPFDIPIVKVLVARIEHNIRTPSYSPGPRMQAFLREREAA